MTRASVRGAPLEAPVPASLVHLLLAASREAPDGIALTTGDRQVSYRDYAGLVAGLAHRFAGHGGGRGERIALVMGNGLPMAISVLAALAAGAQVVPLNPLYTARELAPILADCAPRILVADTSLAPSIAELLGPDTILLAADTLIDDAWASLGPVALADFAPEPSDLALLQYTGGTTGRSKGVNLTHAQLCVNIEQREARLPTRPGEETILCVMPLFHVFAFSMCLALAIRARSRLVILPRYKPEAVMAALTEERVTIFPAGPTIFTGLLSTPGFEALDVSALRACYSGSAPLPEEILLRWREVTGTFIFEGFGQTEAGPVLTYAGPATSRKVGSVGPPLDGTEIEIVDLADRSRVLARGEPGEIRARGPQIMAGYRNLPAETAEALEDGWLYTGDIGELDADGYLFVRDRKKDMVIVGGYNVYPREVDEVLFGHPAIAEAAAFGIPDPFYGEVIVACVVLRDGGVGVEELLAYAKTHLAPYKVPRRIDIVEGLPKTAAGKIDKLALKRAQIAEAISFRQS